MARHLLIGFIILLGMAVYTAPATLVSLIIGGDKPLRLAKAEGSLWAGKAAVIFKEQPIGQLNWSFAPLTLLRGDLEFTWSLEGAAHEASGEVKVDFNRWTIMATSTIESDSIRKILKPYQIEVGGKLTITKLEAMGTHKGNSPTYSGTVNWTGGEVRYQLSRRTHKTTLPPLFASIETKNREPTLVAHTKKNELPLMKLKLDKDGWVHVGITKEFLQLVGQPWIGNGPNHAIVIEVTEQLL
jgi:hypothetical protein